MAQSGHLHGRRNAHLARLINVHPGSKQGENDLLTCSPQGPGLILEEESSLSSSARLLKLATDSDI
jgi:hypothetical protein